MDIPFKKTGYPLYSSEALIGSLHFLEVDKHGQQQGKIKTGLTQRRGERRERLLIGKLCRLFLALRSLRLKRAKRTGVSQVVCVKCHWFIGSLFYSQHPRMILDNPTNMKGIAAGGFELNRELR